MIDPITAAALISGGTALLSGVAGGIGARRQARRQEGRAQDALTRATEIKDAAMAAREQGYGMAPSYADLRKLVNQDPTSDYLRQQAMRQEAGQLQALAGGGARALLGGTQSVARGTADTMARIAAEEQARRSKGLQTIGAVEQRIQEQKLGDARGDLALGRGLEAEALGAQAQAEELRAAANQQMVQGAIQGAGSLAMAGYNEGFFSPKVQAVPNTSGDVNDLLSSLAGPQMVRQTGMLQGIDPYLFGMATGNPYTPPPATNAEGGVIRGKTPGEFSHDSNPIDIMQDGAKIGEMTGGEGIVSPEDLGKLEQLAGEGKTSLHKFVRRLIKKLESNTNG